jgi:hypothetical protein
MLNENTGPELIETEMASIERIHSELVTVRIKEGVSVSARTVRDMLEERKRSFGATPHHVLMVAPADLEFDVKVMYTDHCGEAQMDGVTKSITWVANSQVNTDLLNLYYAYFPSKVPMSIVLFEQESQAILAKLMAATSLN